MLEHRNFQTVSKALTSSPTDGHFSRRQTLGDLPPAEKSLRRFQSKPTDHSRPPSDG
jgi:hypothetical protein